MWREWGQGQRGPSGEEEVGAEEVLGGAWGHQGEFDGFPGPWFLAQLCLSGAAAEAAEAAYWDPQQ